MSGLFPDDAYDGPADQPAVRPQRRRALLYTALVMVALFFAAERLLTEGLTAGADKG